jgi:hypothetical protein
LLLAFAPLPQVGAQSRSYDLPYTAVDGLMVVTITVDEKPRQMVFDTGAVATFLRPTAFAWPGDPRMSIALL